MARASATAGERASAAWLAARLAAAGAAGVREQRFRYQRSWFDRQGPHVGAGLAAAAIGGRAGAALALAAAASLEADYSGRAQLLAPVAPVGQGANVWGRIRARGPRRRTLLLVAHHDAARTGPLWRLGPLLASPLGRALARRLGGAGVDGNDPLIAAVQASLLTIALARGRRPRAIAAATLVATLALTAATARGEVVPGANDNASGVAAVLALCERLAREPLAQTEVIALLTGCEESGMGGCAAWLRAHGHTLEGRTTLVVGLDNVGSGEPVSLWGEGGAVTVRYRDAELDLVDGAARSEGLSPPRRFRLGTWTDPVLFRLAGLPAVSLVSLRGRRFPNYHVPTDTPDRVDWQSVVRCTRLALATALEWDRT